MSNSHHAEIDHNYDFFQRSLATLLLEHRGEYALIRHQKIIGWFAKPGDAYRDGLARFADRIFSIQEATDEPVELGAMSFVLD